GPGVAAELLRPDQDAGRAHRRAAPQTGRLRLDRHRARCRLPAPAAHRHPGTTRAHRHPGTTTRAHRHPGTTTRAGRDLGAVRSAGVRVGRPVTRRLLLSYLSLTLLVLLALEVPLGYFYARSQGFHFTGDQ